MLALIVLIALIGAVAGWQQPWWDAPAPTPARSVSAVLGAALALGLGLPLWWWHRTLDGPEALKRVWQTALLALIGGGLGGLLGLALSLTLGGSGPWGQVSGILILLGALGGGAWGWNGPVPWGALWRHDPPVERTGTPKLLDTSVLIDGRIGDLVRTGFIEGDLVLPNFILAELHHIADSSDSLRRRKGRRGLDILNDLQCSAQVRLETYDAEPAPLVPVDRRLIELAKALSADLITTDFNLNKVAKVEGIKVLNVNELANAVKPRYLPGEDLEVEVIDRGEEIGQGIGYLDDGTMVVVENGRRFIGKKVDVVVNSTLQTEAGKMLFVRLKGETRQR